LKEVEIEPSSLLTVSVIAALPEAVALIVAEEPAGAPPLNETIAPPSAIC